MGGSFVGELGCVGRVYGRGDCWHEEEGAGRGGDVEGNFWGGVGGLAWEDGKVYTRRVLSEDMMREETEFQIWPMIVISRDN